MPRGSMARRSKAPSVGFALCFLGEVPRGGHADKIMILADINLARRIDGFEARGSQLIGEEAQRRNPEALAFVKVLGEGVAVYSGQDSPVNKIIGLGFGEPLDMGALEQIEEAYFERGSSVQAEISTLASPSVHALFTARGYTLQGFENVLGRLLSEADRLPHVTTGVTVEDVPASTLDAWIDILIDGFERPDETGAGSGIPLPSREAIVYAFARFAELPGFFACLARRGNDAAGGGGLRIGEGIAQLCGAATLPAYRGRGIQSALLSWRLSAAYGAGCDLAIMTAQPGSRSHFNAQRQGFMLLYSRAILVKTLPESHS